MTPSTIQTIRQLADQAFVRSAGAPLVMGNAAGLLFDSHDHFPAWIAAMAAATESIMVEMYLIDDDSFGREFRRALIERAQNGVRVWLLYDALGCFKTHISGFFKPLRQAGVEVRAYHPPGFIRSVGFWGRNHRKLIIVDRQQAFISGLCVSARWAGQANKGQSAWRDTGVHLTGPVVYDAVLAFADSWNTSGESLDEAGLLAIDYAPCGHVAARLIATTPSTAHMMRLDLLIASFARHTLWLTDAYFVSTGLYLTALRQAALDGVDVRVLVPRSSDIAWVATVSRTLYRPLLEAGVRVYEWNGPMMHAKTAVADGRWARIGSSNLNLASWFANREIDVAIEDEDIAAQMALKYLQDLEQSTEIILVGQRRQPRPIEPRRPGHIMETVLSIGGHPSATARRVAAARQAARLGDAVSAVVQGSRTIEASEAPAFLSIGVVLVVLAVLMLCFPYLVIVPLAGLLALVGGSVVWRAVGLFRGQRTEDRSGNHATRDVCLKAGFPPSRE